MNKMDKEFENDLRLVLNTEEGRNVLRYILEATKINCHGFVLGDPYATAFQCGQRSIGLLLQNKIMDISPIIAAQMYSANKKMEEAENDRKN